MTDRTSIAVSRREYDQLAQAKQVCEQWRQQQMSWGEFLTFVALGMFMAAGMKSLFEGVMND